MTYKPYKSSPYIIRLIENDKMLGTYRVSKEMFLSVQNEIKPYQTFKEKTKKVKCIETGEIFDSAKQANEILIKKGLSCSYTAYNIIKDVCHKKRKAAYGYHWEFVED